VAGGEDDMRRPAASFFVASALMEATAGLALLAMPALVVARLLAGPITNADLALGRFAGAALLSLGAACWAARANAGSTASTALVTGMLGYNTVMAAIVLAGTSRRVGDARLRRRRRSTP
jgi:hypothetical protein